MPSIEIGTFPFPIKPSASKIVRMEIIVEKPKNLSPCCDSWQQIMKTAIRDSKSLLQAVGLSIEQFLPSQDSGNRQNLQIQAEKEFPVFVPKPFLSRIQPKNPEDPLLKQVLAIPEESDSLVQTGFVNDPLKELKGSAKTESGIIKKYHGRALLMTTGACGVHCRYCFRRHFPYQQLPKDRLDWTKCLTAVSEDQSLKEIILSGGDPLVLTDKSLLRLSSGLEEINHVQWIRIHSRMPIVIPQRITTEFLDCFDKFKVKTFVIHCNHAREIDDNVNLAIESLRRAGWTVLNQTVLLKGVNDSTPVMKDLCEKLVESGVQPYYLHLLDPVRGAAHFDVQKEKGQILIDKVRELLPGHAVPRLVVENPGKPYKTLLA